MATSDFWGRVAKLAASLPQRAERFVPGEIFAQPLDAYMAAKHPEVGAQVADVLRPENMVAAGEVFEPSEMMAGFLRQGLTRVNPDKSVTFTGQRGGGEFSDPRRGGTWYEVKARPEEKSGYSYGNPLAKIPPGVGGPGLHTREVTVRNPLGVDISEARNEGEYPLYAHKELFGEMPSRRGLTGYKAEENYAKLERGIADEARKRGHDAVVFFWRAPKGSVGEGQTYPTQLFHLGPSADSPVKE